MNETRKMYRTLAELGKKHKKHVPVLAEDLLAFLEDADELDGLRAAHVTERPDLYRQLARELVLAGIYCAQFTADGVGDPLKIGVPQPAIRTCSRPAQMGADEWSHDLRAAVESLRKLRTRLVPPLER